MEKHCKKCNVKLVIGDNWTLGKKNSKTYSCRSCTHKHHMKYLKSKEDGNWHNYIIDDYAGITKNPWKREREHGTAGRDRSTFRVIHSTPFKDEARELEALLHDIGYKGRHLGQFRSYRT